MHSHITLFTAWPVHEKSIGFMWVCGFMNSIHHSNLLAMNTLYVIKVLLWQEVMG